MEGRDLGTRAGAKRRRRRPLEGTSTTATSQSAAMSRLTLLATPPSM
ncbi:hypothetical protein I552_1499 [Mycobacterium xenopi 3993]|nr:hypothetical protein I552_1499 [Mycobacterium xenopi 3993]